jgi:hypothetical protein
MAHRTAPTVKKLAERYIEEHLPKLATTNASDPISKLHKLVLPEWKGRMVADITPTYVGSPSDQDCRQAGATRLAEGDAETPQGSALCLSDRHASSGKSQRGGRDAEAVHTPGWELQHTAS